MRWYRDDRRVFQGRLPWRYELAPLPRECSLEYPPSCLFSAIPSSPFFLPLRHFSLSLSPFLMLLSLSLLPPFAFFSPVYIRIHSAVHPIPPCIPSLFLHPCRSFRLFCSQADSPMEATVAVSLLFSLLSRHLIAHRPPRDFISSRRV